MRPTPGEPGFTRDNFDRVNLIFAKEPNERNWWTCGCCLSKWKVNSWTPIFVALGLSTFITISAYAVFILVVWKGDTQSLLEDIAELHYPEGRDVFDLAYDEETHPRPVALTRMKRSTAEDVMKIGKLPCCKTDPECVDKLNALTDALDALKNQDVTEKLRILQKDLIVLRRIASQLTTECHSRSNQSSEATDDMDTYFNVNQSDENDNLMSASSVREIRVPPPGTNIKRYATPATMNPSFKSVPVSRMPVQYSDSGLTGPGESMKTYQQISIVSPRELQPLCYTLPLDTGRMGRICTSYPVPQQKIYSQRVPHPRQMTIQDDYQMNVPTAVGAQNPYYEAAVGGSFGQQDEYRLSNYPPFNPQTGLISIKDIRQQNPVTYAVKPALTPQFYQWTPFQPQQPFGFPPPAQLNPQYPEEQYIQTNIVPENQRVVCSYFPIPGDMYRFPPVQGVTSDSFKMKGDPRISEEAPKSKTEGICGPGRIACDTGECVESEQWCDGITHCVDSSDEARCSCRKRIPIHKICDGYKDCPHGEDEIGCTWCPTGTFNCEDWSGDNYQSTCINIANRCDDVAQCPNKKDEMDCTLLTDHLGPKEILVSYGRGYLHRNLRGIWYPVCTQNIIQSHLAQSACTAEFGPQHSLPAVTHVAPMTSYRGKFVRESPLALVNSCLDGKVSWVDCPRIDCGMKSPQALAQEMATSRFKRFLQEHGLFEAGTPNNTHVKVCRYPQPRTVPTDLLGGYFPRLNPEVENDDFYNRVWGNLNFPYMGYFEA
uniref:Serine protease nudel n=1 Tax=Lygus hesperus TaxID=30085 RepID=A0A0A9X779_LYGHE